MRELIIQTIIDGMANGTIDQNQFNSDEAYRNSCFDAAIETLQFVNKNFKTYERSKYGI